MRDGIDYEFTIVFDINMKHQAIASKDRTNLFMGKPDFTITPTTGQIILDWCNDGVTVEMIRQQINTAKTIEELTAIYHKYPEWYQQLTSGFMQKKMQLQEEQNKPISMSMHEGQEFDYILSGSLKFVHEGHVEELTITPIL